MDLNLQQRDELINLLSKEYVIPDEFIEPVKAAIKQYATKNYSDETIHKIVSTPQSLHRSLVLIGEKHGKKNLSLFRGIISEWLVCAEYNTLKNKGNVIMTITNPDTSSKADLLHILDTGRGYKVIAGPDIKCGGSTYVFNQWEKIVTQRYDIPMVDVDGVLTTYSGLKQLTKGQMNKLKQLEQKFPNKRPIPTRWQPEDINRLIADYLKMIEFEVYPSDESNFSVEDIDVLNLKNRLYNGEIKCHASGDWNDFLNESNKIFSPEIQQTVLKRQKINNEIQVTQQKVPNLGGQQIIQKSQGFVGKLTNFAKGLGKSVIDSIKENPEIWITGVITIGMVLADSDKVSLVNEDYDGLERNSISEQKNLYYSGNVDSSNQNIGTHVYPEERKSPKVHLAHRNGRPYLRGGTPEEKQKFYDENNFDF